MEDVLRHYQIRTISKAREAFRDGSRSILIVAPTGAGKTVIGSTIARSAGSRGNDVLWLAHREELVDQAKAKLPSNMHVATIQGLLASGKRPEASFVIFDEAHHFVADRWRTIAEHYKSAVRIGLTATPQRGDGTGLGDMFSSMVVAAEYSELIQGGHIVPCDVVAPSERKQTLAMAPEGAVMQYASDRQSIVFVSTVDESKRVAAAIGPQAVAIDGTTDWDIRRETIRRYREGIVRHLVNVFVFTEGFDAPSASVCILARGTSVEGAYVQMVGRVLRSHPGKDRALLVDLVGACWEFGMPTDDRKYQLTKGKIKKPKPKPLWVCKACGMASATRPRNSVCPSCGDTISTPLAIEIEVAKLERRERVKRHSRDVLDARWRELCAIAQSKGYKKGWAYYRFKEQFGFPPRSWFPSAGYRS